MKKFTVLIVAGFFCLPALSQESESTGNVPEIAVVARLDANPVVPLYRPIGSGFDASEFFGSSSLYTLIDGSVGDWFSYSVANHWLSTDPASLYKRFDGDDVVGANLFYSDDVNWLDWANVTFSLGGDWGGLDFTLGKDVTLLGSMEFEDYDFNCYENLASYFWREYNVYQWGASVRYTLPDEMNSLAFQWQASPFGERTFASKLFNYSLQWRGEYDWGTFNWSTNFMQRDQNKYMNIIALGQEFYAGDFTFRLDLANRAFTTDNFFKQESQFQAGVLYNIADKVEIALKGGLNHLGGDYDYLYDVVRPEVLNSWYAGGYVNWYPLKDSRDLKVHATVSYGKWPYKCAMGLGITYNFRLNNLFSK